MSVLALILCADKELALFYAFLGWYPALRNARAFRPPEGKTYRLRRRA